MSENEEEKTVQYKCGCYYKDYKIEEKIYTNFMLI